MSCGKHFLRVDHHRNHKEKCKLTIANTYEQSFGDDELRSFVDVYQHRYMEYSDEDSEIIYTEPSIENVSSKEFAKEYADER